MPDSERGKAAGVSSVHDPAPKDCSRSVCAEPQRVGATGRRASWRGRSASRLLDFHPDQKHMQMLAAKAGWAQGRRLLRHCGEQVGLT